MRKVIKKLDFIFELVNEATAEHELLAQARKKSDRKDKSAVYSGYGFEYNYSKREMTEHITNLETLLWEAYNELEGLIKELKKAGDLTNDKL